MAFNNIFQVEINTVIIVYSNSTCLSHDPKGETLIKMLNFYGLSLDMDSEPLFTTHYKNLCVKALREDDGFKIPPISDYIWLTNLNKPK